MVNFGSIGKFDNETKPLVRFWMKIFVGIVSGYTFDYGDQFATDSISLPNANVSVDVFSNNDESALIKVQVGNNSDEDYINFPTATESEHVESNLNLSASYFNDILTLVVADGESVATAQVFIDANVNNNFGGGGSDVSCDNISQEIQDCCNQILNAVNVNYNKIQEVENYLTIDLSDQVLSDYKFEFVKDDDGDIIPTYAEAKPVTKSFSGIGIEGINERLKFLAQNQDSIFKELVKAIPPPVNIPLEPALKQICADNRLKTEADFENEQGFFDYLTSEVQDILGDSILSALIKRLKFVPGGGTTAFAVSTTLSWATGWLVEQLRGEQHQSTAVVCEGLEPQEVVTLVASEGERTHVEGKILVIQFVTLNNYPKRLRNSSYRPIQVPAPKETYDWNSDFKDLRWMQGNQYASLVLEGHRHGVSGWFADVATANVFFDAVLNFTTATETNRLYPQHKTPKTNYLVRESRPWRAFISRQNDNGEPETLTKYFPPPE